MDAGRFDTLTRSLTTTGSRRQAVVATLGGVLGVLGLADPDATRAAKSPKCKRKPNECERCDRGKCTRKNGEKRCKAGKIKPKAFGTPCSIGTCQNGACIAATQTTAPPSRSFCEASGSTLCTPSSGGSFECSSDPTQSCVCMLTESGSRICADPDSFRDAVECADCDQEGESCLQYNQPGNTGCTTGLPFVCALACPNPKR